MSVLRVSFNYGDSEIISMNFSESDNPVALLEAIKTLVTSKGVVFVPNYIELQVNTMSEILYAATTVNIADILSVYKLAVTAIESDDDSTDMNSGFSPESVFIISSLNSASNTVEESKNLNLFNRDKQKLIIQGTERSVLVPVKVISAGSEPYSLPTGELTK